MNNGNKIGYPELIKIFFRSLLIQAVYNYQSMLAIGFCYAIIPISKKLFKNPQKRKKFYLRHLHFFNAHPYFSSYALGAIARLEEEQVKDNSNDYSKIERLKNALIGPLGALGDQLIWITIRPASILFAMASILIIKNNTIQLIILALAVILYNIPHIYIRFNGIINGYRQGVNVYKLLTLDNFRLLRNIYQTIGSFSVGVLISYSLTNYSGENIFYGLIFIISMICAYLYKKFRQSFYGSILIPLTLAILLGVLIENI
jgi:PTS system mannose-specific IID component